MSTIKLSVEDKRMMLRLLVEAEEALKVLEDVVSRDVLDLKDRYAMRYAIVQIVESLAIISLKIAEKVGRPIESYVEALSLLSKVNVVNEKTGLKLKQLS